MALDKAIKYKKEKRKPYRGGKAISAGCRNHNWCSYCRSNRLYQYLKAKTSSDDSLKEYQVSALCGKRSTDVGTEQSTVSLLRSEITA